MEGTYRSHKDIYTFRMSRDSSIVMCIIRFNLNITDSQSGTATETSNYLLVPVIPGFTVNTKPVSDKSSVQKIK